MGMGATASGPTGSPDEYVVTYCGVRARDAPALLPFSPRRPPLARGRRLRRRARCGSSCQTSRDDERWRPALTTPPRDPHPPARRTETGASRRLNAAKDAIQRVHKNAKVVPNRVDSYPITVTVSKAGETIWSGRQQKLFAKNGRPAQAEIMSELKKRSSA